MINVDIRARLRVQIDIGDKIVITEPIPDYEGPYEITPTEEAQTLPTAGTKLTDNITVNPIPNNYGLITWNGSFIRVSQKEV